MSYTWNGLNSIPAVYEGKDLKTGKYIGSVSVILHTDGWKHLAGGKYYGSIDEAKGALIKSFEESEARIAKLTPDPPFNYTEEELADRGFVTVPGVAEIGGLNLATTCNKCGKVETGCVWGLCISCNEERRAKICGIVQEELSSGLDTVTAWNISTETYFKIADRIIEEVR